MCHCLLHLPERLPPIRAFGPHFFSTFTANAFFNAMNGMDTTLFTFLVLPQYRLMLAL